MGVDGSGCDRDIDAKVARTALRPIPSGQISVRGAVAYVVIASLISLGILLTLGLPAVTIFFQIVAVVSGWLAVLSDWVTPMASTIT